MRALFRVLQAGGWTTRLDAGGDAVLGYDPGSFTRYTAAFYGAGRVPRQRRTYA